MGKGRTGVVKGEFASAGERQVLQGHCAICPLVRKQDVGPEPGCHGQNEGFHIRAAYRMAKEHTPRRGMNHQWTYSSSKKVLEEWGMHTIRHYIDVRKETIAKYVVGRTILAECQGADRKRGLVPRRWWWEQKMCMEDV